MCPALESLLRKAKGLSWSVGYCRCTMCYPTLQRVWQDYKSYSLGAFKQNLNAVSHFVRQALIVRSYAGSLDWHQSYKSMMWAISFCASLSVSWLCTAPPSTLWHTDGKYFATITFSYSISHSRTRISCSGVAIRTQAQRLTYRCSLQNRLVYFQCALC